jgi:Rrf2 family protein
MRHDSRLTRMLHVLIHMHLHNSRATSETIARMLDTNPVVVRRTMAGLRDHGYVHSERGHGGGWTLARPLEELTVLDIHRALGEGPLFAIGPAADHPDCAVERTVNAAVEQALKSAEEALMVQFGAITLADLARTFDRRSTGDSLAELSKQ